MDVGEKGNPVNVPTDFTTLKEWERENRKTLIINAAERVFAEKLFHQVRMKDIANEAGITPTSIYRYFSDKQALYVEAHIRSNNRLFEKLVDVLEGSTDLIFEEIAITTIDHFINEEQNLKMRAYFMIVGSMKGELLLQITDNNKKFLDKIDKHIQRFASFPDTKTLAITFIAALNGILLTYRKTPGKSEKEFLRNIHKDIKLISEIFTYKAEISPR